MGCGASTQQQQQQQQPAGEASKEAPQEPQKAPAAATPTPAPGKAGEELQGKQKYIGDIGAAIMGLEEKKALHTVFIAYAPTPRTFTFVYYQHVGEKKMYCLEVDDTQLTTLVKDDSKITFGWNAVFKSIASELQRSKAKCTIADRVCTAEIVVTTVKEKTTQLLKVAMRDVGTVTPNHFHKHIITPLMVVAAKRRAAQEEREKEVKASRMQTLVTFSDANLNKYKATVARVLPLIIPLREEAARHAKASAELTAKVASLDRKIKQLQRGKGGNVSNLDAMYEQGGPQPYQHLLQADEHYPRENILIGDASAEYLKAAMPRSARDNAPIEEIVAPPSDPTLKQLYANAPADILPGVLQVLRKIDSWDMSVFELEKATNNNALFYVTYAILYKLDLVRHFNIDDTVLRTFLSGVQAGYHPNAYHNSTHAADVTQINYFIMVKCGLVEKLQMSKEEVFAGVVAGCIHDYDHPGFNNSFHTRTNAYLSTLYNDRSILENHHLACIFEMMRQPKYNIFGKLTDEQRREARDTMCEMVLSTDMGNHGKIFQAFRRRLGERPDWTARTNSREDARLALAMSIKMADISNSGRPNHLYLEWAKNIAQEFYKQGDAEANLCLSISPFMDRSKDRQEFPKGQISFMNFVVVPMFECLSEFLPPLEVALKCCTENKEYWQQLEM